MPFKGIVVDDEALVRNGIIAKINNYCMDVIITGEAKNGFDALNLIHKMEIDFVITDIKMPIMDGIELIKQVREQNPLIEFIIISGYAEFEFAKKAIFLGVSDYILKPIENEVLREALDRIIKNIDNKSKQNKVMETYVLSSQNQFLNFEHALNYILFRSGTDNMNIREFKELEEFKQKFFTMAVVHIETSKIDCYEDYTDFRRNRDRLKQKMLNYAMKENGVLICDNLKDSTELFVILNGNSKAAIHEIADNFLLRLYGLIVKDEAISITIGKSDIVDDISGFSLMYKHASSALDQRYKYGGNHIYFYSKTEKTEDIGTIQLLRSLAVCLDQDDLTKVKSGAKQIIEKIFSSDYLASRSKYEIQMLFNQIINEIVKFSLKHEVELNEHIKFEVISGEIISSFNRNKEFIEFLMKLLSDIIDRGSLSGIDTRTLIQFIKREIDRNFSRDITLDYISRKYGISSKYFSALFKKEVGMNFIDYLNQIRIEESKILLDGSEISISDIAESVGYKYIHYFYKLFKRMTGVTPMEYRNYRRK